MGKNTGKMREKIRGKNVRVRGKCGKKMYGFYIVKMHIKCIRFFPVFFPTPHVFFPYFFPHFSRMFSRLFSRLFPASFRAPLRYYWYDIAHVFQGLLFSWGVRGSLVLRGPRVPMGSVCMHIHHSSILIACLRWRFGISSRFGISLRSRFGIQALPINMGKRVGSEVPSSSTKKPRTVTLKEKIHRALIDNFRGWNQEDLYVRKVNGTTVAEKIEEDVKQKEAGADIVMGALYYRTIKASHMHPAHPINLLSAPTEKQTVEPALLKAAAATKKARPDHIWVVCLVLCKYILCNWLAHLCIGLPFAFGAYVCSLVDNRLSPKMLDSWNNKTK